MSQARKRSRSISSSSEDSISTISTDRSLSPKRPRRGSMDEYINSQRAPHDLAEFIPRGQKRRRKSSSTESESRSDQSSIDERRRGNGRRRRNTESPQPRGRPIVDRRGSHRSRSGSRSHSVDHDAVTRGRKSMTPISIRGGYSARNRIGCAPEDRPLKVKQDRGDFRDGRGAKPLRERSLSPYSKRMALTQAMNKGR